MKTKQSYYRVFKKFDEDDTVLMNDKSSRKKGKWYCYCEYEQKTGIICSHLAKVLIHLGEDFMNNLHPRWMIDPATITKRIMNYKYVGKFLSLRNKHKIRVKGYKKARGMFECFNECSTPYGMESTTEYDDMTSNSNFSMRGGQDFFTEQGEESYENGFDSTPLVPY